MAARVAPAVGAVTNFGVLFDDKTGRVAVVPMGQGSGVTIRRDGLFLTNVHVVAGAARITVAFAGGRLHEARLFADTSGTGGGASGDIALLMLEGMDDFPFVDWRAVEPGTKLPPGSFVFAMGNPFGHAADGPPVMTLGIVSGSGRAASEQGYLYVDVVQTDAEINPGNSGGPLFDARGRLVGINGLIATREGRFHSGVGFAIPIDQLRVFLTRMLKDGGGDVAYGYHGLVVETAPGESGAQVVAIAPGSPAAEAGIPGGAVIVQVNGKKVRNKTDFTNLVGKLPERTAVTMMYRRDRDLDTVRFRLGAAPARPGAAAAPLPLARRGFLGATWKEADGIRIERVVTASALEALKPGDRIVAVQGSPVAEAKQLVSALAPLPPGGFVALTVEREGKTIPIKVKLCDALEAAR